MLSNFEVDRYDRQMKISGFGEDGQKKLKKASILVAGSGGLGFPISAYLISAGIGKMKIVDDDSVELSNLNRQLLHWNKDIGRRKVDSAYEKLTQMNPEVKVEATCETINENNVLDLVRDVDAIVDAMDNFSTRYILNRAAWKKRIPFFHGGVYELTGQATTLIPGETACLKCIFPQAPEPEEFPILGSVAGVIGSIQATEVLKYFTKIGILLKNRLLIFDGESSSFYTVEVMKDSNCSECKGK